MERNRNWRGSIYESPLNGLKKSLEELNNLVGSIAYNGDKRLTRGMLKLKLSKQNSTHSSKTSSRNSVIVINDSETDDGDEDNNDDETNDRNEGDASLSIIKCKLKSPLQRKKRSRISINNKRDVIVENRSSVTPLDNNSSVILLDTQESLLHGENIAPSKTADDVVELWSCLKNSSNGNKDQKNTRCNRETENETEMFVIDKRPNLKYLRLLKSDTNSTPKRAKKQKNILLPRDKTVSIENINQIKCSNKNQRKRKYNDSLDSSLTELNAHHNKKKIDSNKKNSNTNSRPKLREIVVDGCNVAMAHTNGKGFSEKGIQIVVDYFKLRGHGVKVFLPQHVRRKKYSYLEQLYKEGTVVFTPSRKIAGRQITSYDDRFILKYATSCGGIVISSDQYRDLYREKPEWRSTILNRLLIPTFVGDYIMFPEDPLATRMVKHNHSEEGPPFMKMLHPLFH